MTATAAGTLTAVEAALDAEEYERALEVILAAGALLREDAKTEFRALLDEAWGRMSIGQVHATGSRKRSQG